MITGINNPLNSALTSAAGPATSPAGGAGGAAASGATSFADVLKNGIEEVSKLQQDASQAVEDLATGKTENVSGVMTAMEKSDLAFQTLLAIRSKLMDAYDEIKGISV
ncbi:MAG TPA: flagellar hook-basal body complex protein FliE [Tepidisphaeraceae bacterium]|jgi:flagellar hook-basal body complex protein FliE|nr:flagellar hook-basal body complex protein FliE [Tepidisphaeraceae bacterium]